MRPTDDDDDDDDDEVVVVMVMMVAIPWLETSSWWELGTERQLPLS